MNNIYCHTEFQRRPKDARHCRAALWQHTSTSEVPAWVRQGAIFLS
ncbi:hypothetical protein [Saezia sanguinis]